MALSVPLLLDQSGRPTAVERMFDCNNRSGPRLAGPSLFGWCSRTEARIPELRCALATAVIGEAGVNGGGHASVCVAREGGRFGERCARGERQCDIRVAQVVETD